MTMFICAYKLCRAVGERPTGEVNRARLGGYDLYCNRVCSGLGRRKHKTEAQKVAEKADYDRARRARLAPQLKAKKAEYHKRTYEPAKAAVVRKGRAAYHVEYCRRPEYRAWKRDYDRAHLAKKHYGEFADAALLLTDLEGEILDRMSRYEIALANGTLNKTTKRKREDGTTVRR